MLTHGAEHEEHLELEEHLDTKNDDPIPDDISEPASSKSNPAVPPTEPTTDPQNTTIHSFSEDPERTKHMERPFSLPQAMEKPQPLSIARQSMPAQVTHSVITSIVSRKMVGSPTGRNTDTYQVDEASDYERVSEDTQSTDGPKSLRQQSFDVTRSSVNVRPTTTTDAHGSWATSIASRVMSEPESTVVSDEPHMSWARSIASRAVSVADGV